MAFTGASVWECRSTGTTTGGAGFDASFGGTDFSQQDAPQLTVTDAACTGGTTLTSATGGFTSLMPGNGVYLSGPNNWFQITAFTNGNTVTLDRTPGTISANTAHVGGAYKIDQNGLAFPYVAGNKLWLRGTFTPGVNDIAITTAGTATLPIVMEGYTTTRGDNGRATITGSAARRGLLLQGAFTIAKNILCDGAGLFAGDLIQLNGNFQILQNCVAQNGAAAGVLIRIAGDDCTVKRCLVDGKGIAVEAGIVANGHTAVVEFCTVTGCGTGSAAVATGFNATGNKVVVEHTIIRNNLGTGFLAAGGSAGGFDLRSNDIWNCGGDGIGINSLATELFGIVIEGNIIGKNAGYDLNYLGATDTHAVFGTIEWANVVLDHNAFLTTGTGRYNKLPGGPNDVVLTAGPFVDDATTFNFQLNNTAGGGALLTGTPWTVTFPDGVNSGIYGYGALGSNAAAGLGSVAAGTAPVIAEVQFPTDISRGAEGGPTFSTLVVSTDSGAEQRLKRWASGRWRYRISLDQRTAAQMATILAFYVNRAGRYEGFRFKDWSDYAATSAALAPTGASTIQLTKPYVFGGATYQRAIYKPVTGTLTVTRGGVSFTAFTLDTTTGLLSLTPDSSANISAITQAAAALVTTTAAHGFTVGQTLAFAGVVGMTAINGLTGVVQSVPTGTSFTVAISTLSMAAYVSGGTVSKYLQPGEAILGTFQFDVPVRFDTDVAAIAQQDVDIRSWTDLELVEVR